MSEEVLVVPTETFDRLGKFQGLLTANIGYYYAELLKKTAYRNRAEMETDPSFKQLIPYCVLSDIYGRVWYYQRTDKGGESRLHSLYSVGVGGHINREDAGESPEHAVGRALNRELNEEVGIDVTKYPADSIDAKLYGILNDDSTPVGKVHLGLVFIVHLQEKVKFGKSDETIKNGHWANPHLLVKRNFFTFETWSSLVLESIGGASLR